MYENITVLDLHIHTKYSIACSKDADLKGYAGLGKLKGIDILGTGDMFKKEHLDDMKKHLIPEEKGIYKYNDQKFMLSGELSLIYRESGIVKKVHILLILSSIEAIDKIKKKILPFGKIESTGRPILKLSTENLIDLVKNNDADSIIIPAHIWTPHFGILGRKSGYDRLSHAVKNPKEFSAMETGLSSDPEMNRYIEELDNFNMVSFSDAHSPGKLAREFTMIKGNELDIDIIRNAFENKNDKLIGTAEFYPEEGKYYASGHRKCNYYTLDENEICPICKKPLTDGVLKRIKALSGRKKPIKHNKQTIYTLPFDRIVRYIKKQKMGTSLKSIRKKLIDNIPETHLTAFMNGKEIDRTIPYSIGYFVEKIRNRELEFNPGYDGVYGEPIIREVK